MPGAQPSSICNVCGKTFGADVPNFCGQCGADLRGLGVDNATRLSTGAPRALATGRLVAGRYKVLEPLGEGGMGAVWKVEHTRIGKIFALKTMRGALLSDRRAVERFEREAKAASGLKSAHTVQVTDFGEDDDGSLFIVMEYVEGKDLATLVWEGGPLDPLRVARIGAQLLAALGEAHEAGLVHRDIKPANVMLVQDRHGAELAKVLDFGFAKHLSGGKRAPGMAATTLTGEIVGTPDYMAPEQIRGNEVTPAADQYAVASTLFHLLTGRAPFVGKNPIEVMTAHVMTAPAVPSSLVPLARVPEALDEALLRGLSKDPAQRFPNADAFRAALLLVAGEAPDTRRRLRTNVGPTGSTTPTRPDGLQTLPEGGPPGPDDPGFEGKTLAAGALAPRLRPQSTGLPVRFGAEGGLVAHEAHANGVSATGMFVRTVHPLREGTRAVIEALLPGDPEPLRAEVRVLFVVPAGGEADPGMGVEFLQLDEAVRARIERAARRRTR